MPTPQYKDLPALTHAEAFSILRRLSEQTEVMKGAQQTMALRMFESKMPARFKFERMRYHYPNLYFDHNEV